MKSCRAVNTSLQAPLKRSNNTLVGNSAHLRYLRTTGKKVYEIDLAKLAGEARFDSVTVFRTNNEITAFQAPLCYRDLLQVEC